MSSQFNEIAEIPREFLREGTQFMNRCAKRITLLLGRGHSTGGWLTDVDVADRREFIKISQAVGIGFVVMGAIGSCSSRAREMAMLISVVGYVVKLSGFMFPCYKAFIRSHINDFSSLHEGLLADGQMQYIFRSTTSWLGGHKEGVPRCSLSAIDVGEELGASLSEAGVRPAVTTTFTEGSCGSYSKAPAVVKEQTCYLRTEYLGAGTIDIRRLFLPVLCRLVYVA